MQPKKKWAASRSLQPRNSVRDAFPRPPVHQSNVFLHESFSGKRIVVEVEAPSQPPTAVQDECADHSSGGIALLLESLCDGAELWRKWLAGEVLDSILKGICAS